MTGVMSSWLPSLTALQYLDVSINALGGSRPGLSSIPGLVSFSVGLNRLTGNLPVDWLSPFNIREFDAVSNR